MHQHESALGIHVSPPSHFPLLQVVTEHQAWAVRIIQHISTGYLIFCMVMSVFPRAHSVLPPFSFQPCPQVCSLRLHLHCCPADWFTSSIFLDPIYRHYCLLLVTNESLSEPEEIWSCYNIWNILFVLISIQYYSDHYNTKIAELTFIIILWGRYYFFPFCRLGNLV